MNQGKFKCRCGSEKITSIQYAWNVPEHYNGISEWRCEDCKTRFGRWTGKVLTGNEREKINGGR